MSTELINRPREGYQLTGFYGGDARGYYLQITSDHGYVQVTREGAARLAADIFRHFLETPGPNDVLNDALSNLEHDNYERSHKGYENRQADIALIRAALTAQPAISGYTCTVPDNCETLHWRGQILSMNELASVAQPVEGEEIMVNAAHDVYTLPLQPSGLSSGPRFVVHVPGSAGDECHCGTCTCNPNMTPAARFDLSPAQQEGVIREHLIRLGRTPPDEHAVSQPAAPSGAVNVVGMPEFDRLLDHIYEHGTAAEGVIEMANAFARAVLAQYSTQQPAAVDEAMVFRLAVWMAKHDGCDDPHRLIYEGSPPVPWGEVWNRYEYDARAALTAAIAHLEWRGIAKAVREDGRVTVIFKEQT